MLSSSQPSVASPADSTILTSASAFDETDNRLHDDAVEEEDLLSDEDDHDGDHYRDDDDNDDDDDNGGDGENEEEKDCGKAVEEGEEEEDVVVKEEEEEEEDYDDDGNRLGSGFVKSFIVSCWDNTMGPRVLQVWNASERKNQLSPDLVTFIARFLLIDEISRDAEIGRRVEIKFNLLRDAEIMVFTSVFRAKQRKSYTIFTTSLVLDIALFQRFTELNGIIRERMISLSKYLRSMCSKKDTQYALVDFDTRLRDFVATFDALNRTSYCDSIDDTFLRAAPEKHWERDFLARALTSHLQTHGYTVVVGQDVSEVNRWVDTLSMFLMPSEKPLCKRATLEGPQTFIPELYVQGLLIEATHAAPSPPSTQPQHSNVPITPISLGAAKRTNSNYNLNGSITGSVGSAISSVSSSGASVHTSIVPLAPPHSSSLGPRKSKRDRWKSLVPIHSLLSGRFPITVIDLQMHQVLHFKLYNYFVVLKKDYQDSELTQRRISRADHNSYKDHFSMSLGIAPCIRKLMDRAFSIPPNLRQALIQETMRDLGRRALCLTKFVDGVLASDSAEMFDGFVPRLRENLELTDKEELNVVLAAAEKIRRDVYTLVAGNPQEGAEAVSEFLNEF